MRLIDADEFELSMQHEWEKNNISNGTWIDMREWLKDAPTIEAEPVRHGEWYWDKDGMDWGIGAWRCSACKAMSPMWWNTDKHSPKNKSGHRYCPNCGAKMDKGETK